jgi:hypothetical protein
MGVFLAEEPLQEKQPLDLSSVGGGSACSRQLQQSADGVYRLADLNAQHRRSIRPMGDVGVPETETTERPE